MTENNIPGYDIQFDPEDHFDTIYMHYLKEILILSVTAHVEVVARKVTQQLNGHGTGERCPEGAARRRLRYMLGLYLLETADDYDGADPSSIHKHIIEWVETKIVEQRIDPDKPALISD